jgi:hypothetical protein
MPYSFVGSSFSEVNAEHKSKYSAWETPDSIFWTKNGYVVVRATSVVSANLLASWIQCRKKQANVSLTRLNLLSNSHCLLEKSDFWASVTTQAVSGELQHASLKVSRPLSLGRNVRLLPRPLSPWCILSGASIRFWWNRQVIINQYGRAGRAAANGEKIRPKKICLLRFSLRTG